MTSKSPSALDWGTLRAALTRMASTSVGRARLLTLGVLLVYLVYLLVVGPSTVVNLFIMHMVAFTEGYAYGREDY